MVSGITLNVYKYPCSFYHTGLHSAEVTVLNITINFMHIADIKLYKAEINVLYIIQDMHNQTSSA